MKQKQTEVKKEIDKSKIIVRDIYTPLLVNNRTNGQKINKGIENVKNANNKLDLIDIYRTFHHMTAEYTVFSSTHGIFTNIFTNIFWAIRQVSKKCERTDTIQHM